MPRLIKLAALLGLIALAGCGGDTTDGETLSEVFAERSEQAYAEQDLVREDDFVSGVVTDDCFVVDKDALLEIGSAVSSEELPVQVAESVAIAGPPGEEEMINCTLEPEGSGPTLSLTVGTTPLDAEGLKERLLGEGGITELEGEAPSLGADDVFAVRIDDNFTRYVWVSDNFLIAVSGAEAELDENLGFEVLGATVPAVSSSLE